MDFIIGCTLTGKVTLNVGAGNFGKISCKTKQTNQPTDRALLSLLQGQAALIQSPNEKVGSLSEATEKTDEKMPPLSLKELHALSRVWNHPHSVTSALYFLNSAVMKEQLPVDKMRMTPTWNDESHKPLLFSPSEDQRQKSTLWTEFEPGAGGTPRDGDTLKPPRALEMNAAAIQMAEALWILVYSSVYCYKNRYESDSSSSRQASSNQDFAPSLSPAGSRLTR